MLKLFCWDMQKVWGDKLSFILYELVWKRLLPKSFPPHLTEHLRRSKANVQGRLLWRCHFRDHLCWLITVQGTKKKDGANINYFVGSCKEHHGGHQENRIHSIIHEGHMDLTCTDIAPRTSEWRATYPKAVRQ